MLNGAFIDSDGASSKEEARQTNTFIHSCATTCKTSDKNVARWEYNDHL